MELANDRVGWMFDVFDVVDGLMKLRIERLADRFPWDHPVGAQEVEQRAQHHINSFDDRLAIAAAACGLDRPLEVVSYWQEVAQQVLALEAHGVLALLAHPLADVF